MAESAALKARKQQVMELALEMSENIEVTRNFLNKLGIELPTGKVTYKVTIDFGENPAIDGEDILKQVISHNYKYSAPRVNGSLLSDVSVDVEVMK